MKILWVKAGGLVPPDTGGKIRSYHILANLTKRHDVTLFTFYAAHAHDIHRDLERRFARVVCLPLKVPRSRTLRDYGNYIRCLRSLRPYSFTKYCLPEVVSTLRRIVAASDYDVLVCDFAIAGAVIPWDIAGPTILFAHNVEASIWKQRCQIARNPLWKAICWREWRSTQRAESTYLRRAHHVIAVSQTDRRCFAQYIHPQKVSVVPAGVDLDFFQPSPDAKGNVLVFTGSMDWIPNEDGIFYFVNEIFPRICRQVTDTELWIVGRRPSERIRSLGTTHRNIHITGWVEDVRPYLRRASVCVVPLRMGGGTRLKIFEAMAMGKPIVATSVGAEGLPVRDGVDILIADEAEMFASAVVELLRDPTQRAELGSAGRTLVTQEYSWPSIATAFEKVLMAVADNSCARAAEGSSLAA